MSDDDTSGLQRGMISTRSVRPNRGQLLKQIIADGFDSSDEEVLREASSSDDDWRAPASSSQASAASSSNSSDYSDVDDDTASDFSDEEDAGKLSDATSGSDAERAARKRLRVEAAEEAQKEQSWKRKRTGAQPLEHRITLVRQASTIPLEQRLREALQRAEAVMGEQLEAPAQSASVHSLIASLRARKVRRASRRLPTDDAEIVPSTMWSSSVALLEAYHSPVVISFSTGKLPPMFSASQ